MARALHNLSINLNLRLNVIGLAVSCQDAVLAVDIEASTYVNTLYLAHVDELKLDCFFESLYKLTTVSLLYLFSMRKISNFISLISAKSSYRAIVNGK